MEDNSIVDLGLQFDYSVSIYFNILRNRTTSEMQMYLLYFLNGLASECTTFSLAQQESVFGSLRTPTL